MMQQPPLALLTGPVVLSARLKIDPTGTSSDALFLNNGILGMLALSSAAVSISVCIFMLGRGISASRKWLRSRSA